MISTKKLQEKAQSYVQAITELQETQEAIMDEIKILAAMPLKDKANTKRSKKLVQLDKDLETVETELQPIKNTQDKILSQIQLRARNREQNECLYPGCIRSKQNTSNAKKSSSSKKSKRGNRNFCKTHWKGHTPTKSSINPFWALSLFLENLSRR